MAIRPIVLAPDERLRRKCRRVAQVDRTLERLVDDLIETMRDAKGIGLAAPQVGVPVRLTVIRLAEDYDDPRAGDALVLVNPEIVKATGEWGRRRAACRSPAGTPTSRGAGRLGSRRVTAGTASTGSRPTACSAMRSSTRSTT